MWNRMKVKVQFSSLGTSQGPKLIQKAVFNQVLYNYYSILFYSIKKKNVDCDVSENIFTILNFLWSTLFGGYWGLSVLFRFERTACYHLNLGKFWNVWPFQSFFSLKKSDPTLVKSHFENTITNPFLKSHFQSIGTLGRCFL